MRVSSDGQLDGYGLDSQERSIRAFVRAQGHTLTRLVRDVGVSGATDALDRPGLSEVLQVLARAQAGGLVVARLDRLARALTVQEATLAVIWQSGAEVFTTDGGRVLADDPDDPMRTALRQVVGVFAELDRRMVVKRLRDGRAAKAATGRKAVGAYPFGYQGDGKGRGRHSALRADEQATVDMILRSRQEGLTYRAIAKLLDDAGRSPRRAKSWSAMSVRAIVLREPSRYPARGTDQREAATGPVPSRGPEACRTGRAPEARPPGVGRPRPRGQSPVRPSAAAPP